jgi:hypothetical protein
LEGGKGKLEEWRGDLEEEKSGMGRRKGNYHVMRGGKIERRELEIGMR